MIECVHLRHLQAESSSVPGQDRSISGVSSSHGDVFRAAPSRTSSPAVIRCDDSDEAGEICLIRRDVDVEVDEGGIKWFK